MLDICMLFDMSGLTSVSSGCRYKMSMRCLLADVNVTSPAKYILPPC